MIAPDITPHFYCDSRIKSSLIEGEPIAYECEQGDSIKTVVSGTVKLYRPFERLIHSYNVVGRHEKETQVMYELEDLKSCVKLRLTHTGFKTETGLYLDCLNSWPIILSKLKTYVETGSPLKF